MTKENSNVVPILGTDGKPLEGDHRSGYKPKGRPDFLLGAPDKPDDLSPAASVEWERIVPELDRVGILSPVDLPLIVGWCETVATFAAATADIRERGVMVPSAREGQPVKSPSLATQRDCIATLRALARLLGIEPSRRTPKPAPAAGGSLADAMAIFYSEGDDT